MNTFKTLLIAAATAATALATIGTAHAQVIICMDSPAATCRFDGAAGAWTDVKVGKNTTASQSFALLLRQSGTLHISVASNSLDLVKIAFAGVTLTNVDKNTSYGFDVVGSNTVQMLTVTMRNRNNVARGFDGKLNFAGVPEPTAWGMMISGFGLAGGAVRRRRTMRVATA